MEVNILGVTWEKIVIGLSAGAIVSVFSWVKNMIQQKYLERKFPVAGEYITKFEDEADGESFICTAPVVLKQRGKKVFGNNYLLNEDRSWQLEGEITTEGHIYGIYYAHDPHDKGIGNFFLFINNNKSMEGLWSGYDSANKKINSGKYSFMPVMNDFKIDDMTQTHLPAVSVISDQQLGKDYLSNDILRKSIEHNGNHISKVVLSKNKEVVGFCIANILSPDELKETLHIKPEDFPGSLLYADNIGLIKVVVIKSEYQKRGVGYKLLNAIIEELSSQNVNVICSTGWRSSKGVNIGNILKNLGFMELNEITNYWHEDSLKNNYSCPDCGEPPCRCSAVIFARFK